MFRYNFLGLVCICFALASSGCATILAPGPDTVYVTSTPPGATVTVDGLHLGQTPLTATVNRKALTIQFSKSGYQTVTAAVPKDFNTWVIGNIVIGGVIGIIIDVVAGNIQKVSGTISANLPAAGSGESEGQNGPDSIAAWFERLREYAQLAQVDPPATK